MRAPLDVPARGLAARASKKMKDAAAVPLATTDTRVAGAGSGDGKVEKAAAARKDEETKMVTATRKGAAVLDQYIPDDMKKSWHVLQAVRALQLQSPPDRKSVV